jgi:hypothetical protein
MRSTTSAGNWAAGLNASPRLLLPGRASARGRMTLKIRGLLEGEDGEEVQENLGE